GLRRGRRGGLRRGARGRRHHSLAGLPPGVGAWQLRTLTLHLDALPKMTGEHHRGALCLRSTLGAASAIVVRPGNVRTVGNDPLRIGPETGSARSDGPGQACAAPGSGSCAGEPPPHMAVSAVATMSLTP